MTTAEEMALSSWNAMNGHTPGVAADTWPAQWIAFMEGASRGYWPNTVEGYQEYSHQVWSRPADASQEVRDLFSWAYAQERERRLAYGGYEEAYPEPKPFDSGKEIVVDGAGRTLWRDMGTGLVYIPETMELTRPIWAPEATAKPVPVPALVGAVVAENDAGYEATGPVYIQPRTTTNTPAVQMPSPGEVVPAPGDAGGVVTVTSSASDPAVTPGDFLAGVPKWALALAAAVAVILLFGGD